MDSTWDCIQSPTAPSRPADIPTSAAATGAGSRAQATVVDARSDSATLSLANVGRMSIRGVTVGELGAGLGHRPVASRI
ncbi:hypothetical protein CBM2634_P190010 [Cupriavidus taiwanensis]|uniref:Uncharacterized protein n=1 Tax=Cupriavidus taiwanensis TaxID=164546 RepID=A0A375JAJ8_9BURK|nr:hypothetical protein CBM2634_P190010 [Cupriavidus taiwanensis]